MPPTYRWFCTVYVEARIAHPDLIPDRTDLGIREVVNIEVRDISEFRHS